jgi:hypothetical protein
VQGKDKERLTWNVGGQKMCSINWTALPHTAQRFSPIDTMPGAGLFRVRSFSCLQTAVCRNVSRHSQAVFPDGSSMGTNYPTHTSSSAYIWTPASPTRVTRARTAQIGVANQRGCRLQPMASKTPDWRSRQESGTKTMPGGCGGEVPESAIMGLR